MPNTSNKPVAHTLIQLLQWRAEENTGKGFAFLPDTTTPEVKFSFTQLDLRARAVAAVLQQRGLKGQRALLCYPPGLIFWLGFLAVSMLGWLQFLPIPRVPVVLTSDSTGSVPMPTHPWS